MPAAPSPAGWATREIMWIESLGWDFLSLRDPPQQAGMGHPPATRPLGSLDFVVSMEKSLGRSLRALPVGRPRTRKPLASDSLLGFG